MIVKLRYAPAVAGADDGWVWLDSIERVTSHGYLLDSKDPAHIASVESHEQLADLVKQSWGEDRAFNREVWPQELCTRDNPRYVGMFVAQRRDDTLVLLIVADEAYLMSDTGATVDRLR
jgi:hypothetical protein